ncbi:MAG: SIS domain-containing protein [Thermoplasmatales archaeon]|nr:SIS domain-containing protein [Thermoplasmatales archaeon]MCW6170227.1 SIS domain-containing protein [Thermoplasmatales archaeon]
MTDDLPEHRDKPPYVMYDMIKEIPKGIQATLSVLQNTDLHFLSDELYFTGNGTAFHSATVGAQVLYETPKKWKSIQAYEMEHFYPPKGTLIAFSHTGKTKSTVDAVKKYRDQVRTVAVTHFEETPLTKAAEDSIIINSPDRSLCNTKAFFDNAFASLEIASEFGEIEYDRKELHNIVEREVNSSDKEIAEISKNLDYVKDVFVLGSGPNFIAAREIAQKLKEATHLHAEGIELEEFNHGCTSVIDKNSLVIIIDSEVDKKRASQIVKACEYTDTRTLVVNGDGSYSLDVNEVSMAAYFPFTYMVQMYYLAYYMAVDRGINPDYLRFEDKRYRDFDNVVFPPGAH